MATIQNRYYPPLKKVIATYNYRRITNLLTPATAYGTAVSCGTTLSTGILRFKGIIRIAYTYDPLNLDDTFRALYDIKIKLVGALGTTYYLLGDNITGVSGWTTTSTDTYKVYGYRLGTNADKVIYVGVSFTTPLLPDNGALTFELDFDEYINWPMGASYTLKGVAACSFTCQGFVLSYLTASGLFSESLFESVNEDVGGNALNSYILDHGELLIGDGALIKEGAVQVTADLATWVLATSWQHAAAGTAYSMTKLLVVEILAGQRVARAVMQGNVFGTMTALNSLVYDSKKWVFGGGEFGAYMDEWNGEWFEIAENRTYITVSESKNRVSYDTGDGLGDTVEDGNLLGSKIAVDKDGNVLLDVPTASAGLPSGALWSDSGVITIVA